MNTKTVNKIEKEIYDENISFGKNSITEYLMTKTPAFKKFQAMSAYVSSILKASNYPFFVVDTNFKIQYMNPACREFTGASLDEITDIKTCKDIFKSDLCQNTCAIQQAMKTKSPVIGKWVKVIDRNNKEHRIIVNAGALINSRGEVLGGFEIWRDAMPETELASKLSIFENKLNGYISNLSMNIDKLRSGFSKLKSKDIEDINMLENMIEQATNLRKSFDNCFHSYCWGILDCPPERQVQCPAFPNNGNNCWEVNYTWCDGQMQGNVDEKKDKCSQCIVYKRSSSENHLKTCGQV